MTNYSRAYLQVKAHIFFYCLHTVANSCVPSQDIFFPGFMTHVPIKFTSDLTIYQVRVFHYKTTILYLDLVFVQGSLD